jgi:thiol-disulfide isomerase/thioredoxin
MFALLFSLSVAWAQVALEPPTQPGSLAPSIVADGAGFRLIWWAPQTEGHALMTARGEGDRWDTPVVIAQGGDYFTNWADTPSLSAGPNQMWLATWPEVLGDTPYAYGVAAAVSSDGHTWRGIGLLHDDTSATEHGFVSLTPVHEGVRAFWLDGRDTLDGGAMSLRTVLVAPDGTLSSAERLDDRVCDCCATGATTIDGAPLVVFRDRSTSEVRDTAIVRLGGANTTPTPVYSPGWQVPGCPVNGPRVASNGAHLAVAAFTAQPSARVSLVQSSDGGDTWRQPLVLSEGASLGRVDIAALADGFVVGWLASTGDDQAAYLVQRVSVDGRVGRKPTTVFRTSASRRSGFPRLVVAQDRVIIAWTAVGEHTQVRVHALDVDALDLPVEIVAPITATHSPEAATTWPSDLSVPTSKGTTLSLGASPKRSTLIHLWATWCAPCRDELLVWAEHQTQFDDNNIDVIALAVDDSSEKVITAMEHAGINWSVGLLSATEANRYFGSHPVPRTFLFDAEGKLLGSHIGPMTPSELQRAIDALGRASPSVAP